MITQEREIDPGNSERRKYPRFSIDWPAEYWLINIPKGRPAEREISAKAGYCFIFAKR